MNIDILIHETAEAIKAIAAIQDTPVLEEDVGDIARQLDIAVAKTKRSIVVGWNGCEHVASQRPEGDDPDALYGDLLDDDADPSGVVGMELFRTMENVGVFGEMRAVSAKEGEGMEEIYGASQQTFFAGEDPDDIF